MKLEKNAFDFLINFWFLIFLINFWFCSSFHMKVYNFYIKHFNLGRIGSPTPPLPLPPPK